MSRSVRVTNSGSGGMMSTADWSCLTHGFPRPSFGTKLLRGGSSVTFVNMQISCTLSSCFTNMIGI